MLHLGEELPFRDGVLVGVDVAGVEDLGGERTPNCAMSCAHLSWLSVGSVEIAMIFTSRRSKSGLIDAM